MAAAAAVSSTDSGAPVPASADIGASRATVLAILADLQFADVPNRTSHGGVQRHYRDSANKLKAAIGEFEAEGVDRIIHAGDIIDGQAKGSSEAAMTAMRDGLLALGKPVHFAIGNHELYHQRRSVVHPLLGLPEGDTANTSFSIGPVNAKSVQPVRVIILDSFDIGVFGRDPSHPNAVHARMLCDAHNSNVSFNDPTGLEGLDKRWVGFNGGISQGQLTWLRAQLGEAGSMGQRVVVVTHVPLHPHAANPKTLAWNFDAVLHVIAHYACVVAVVSGHDHTGGYTVDSNGVHHIVLPGLVELPPGQLAYVLLSASWDARTGRPLLRIDPRGAARTRLGLVAQEVVAPRTHLAEGLRTDRLQQLDPEDEAGGVVVDWSRGGLCCEDLASFLAIDDAGAPGGVPSTMLEVVAPAAGYSELVSSTSLPSRLLSVVPEAEAHGRAAKSTSTFAPWTAASVSTVSAGQRAVGSRETEGMSAYADASAPPADKIAAASAAPSVIGLFPAVSADRAVYAVLEVTSIAAVDLSHNPLHDLPGGSPVWAALAPGLRDLRLAGCNLARVPDVLNGLTALHGLDLSSNMLSVLPEWAGRVWGGLRALDLSGNAFSDDSLAVLGELSSLKSLKLSDNDGPALSCESGVLATLRGAGCEILL